MLNVKTFKLLNLLVVILALMGSLIHCGGYVPVGTEFGENGSTLGGNNGNQNGNNNNQDDQNDDNPLPNSAQVLEDAKNSISQARLTADMAFVAGNDKGGRLPATAADQTVRDYIEAAFKAAGLEPGMGNSYQQVYLDITQNANSANVVGILPGSDPVLKNKFIVVGAHHDHLGTENGQIYNGANDNGSGTVSIMEMARAAGQAKGHFKRSILFMTFGSEEDDEGFLGSTHYVENPIIPFAQTDHMLNMDMVGTYASEQIIYLIGNPAFDPKYQTMMKAVTDKYPAYNFDYTDVGDDEDSDYASFKEYNIPFSYFFTDDLVCYHDFCDDPNNIDYASLTDVNKMAFEYLVKLANSDNL